MDRAGRGRQLTLKLVYNQSIDERAKCKLGTYAIYSLFGQTQQKESSHYLGYIFLLFLTNQKRALKCLQGKA